MDNSHITTTGRTWTEGIADDVLWQHRWRRLDAQSASWYATPSGAVEHHFTERLAAEWRGVLDRSWNSERPFVFAPVVLTKTFGVRRDQEIWAGLTRWMDLSERGLYEGLVGDADTEGDVREGRDASGG